MNWQPIETAPKDGRRIIVSCDGRVRTAYWTDNGEARRPKPYWYYDSAMGVKWVRNNPPTHWMPLPEPPQD